MKITYPVSLLVITLVGCATSRPQEDIDRLAKSYYHIHICGEAGMLDQETAAKGMSLINSQVYKHESPRIQESGKRYAATGVKADAKNCSNLRLQILTALASKGAAPAPTQSYQPVTTNCSTYYGQTHCTSY